MYCLCRVSIKLFRKEKNIKYVSYEWNFRMTQVTIQIDSRYSRSTVTMWVSTFVSPNAEFLA